MNLNDLMRHYKARVEQRLDEFLPPNHIQPTRLHESMRYAVFGGGKRIRPLLVYLTGSLLKAAPEALDSPACSVELIHAYSLIHDDLPAMDDDELRHGQPTCHKAFDEATAILAGDALQALAFHVLTQDPWHNTTAEKQVAMVDELAMAAGSRGMAGGQCIDLEATGKEITLAELENMHIHKTGALIRAAAKMGALASQHATDEALEKLDHYAKCIGLAFQIQDDILDVSADAKVLGKTPGSDKRLHKPTYPELLGPSGAHQMANELMEDALASLVDFDEQADPLRWLAEYVVTRRF
ncbi:MAG: (2E,6E)-farnesyl diphosphate synthase [Pseudomonadota bacterium]